MNLYPFLQQVDTGGMINSYGRLTGKTSINLQNNKLPPFGVGHDLNIHKPIQLQMAGNVQADGFKFLIKTGG